MATKTGNTVVLKNGSRGFVLLANDKIKKAIISLDKLIKSYPVYDKEVNAVIVPFADIKTVVA